MAMSDRPLFQNTDEQEAAYAPQQLPDDADHVSAEDDAADRNAVLPVAALPIAATGAAANSAGPGYAGGTAGTAGGVVPAIGAVALANELENQDDDKHRRD
jgi:hypothetical protein